MHIQTKVVRLPNGGKRVRATYDRKHSKVVGWDYGLSVVDNHKDALVALRDDFPELDIVALVGDFAGGDKESGIMHWVCMLDAYKAL